MKQVDVCINLGFYVINKYHNIQQFLGILELVGSLGRLAGFVLFVGHKSKVACLAT